jgi:hypothetical protein
MARAAPARERRQLGETAAPQFALSAGPAGEALSAESLPEAEAAP